MWFDLLGSDMLQAKMKVPPIYLSQIQRASKGNFCDKFFCTGDQCLVHNEQSKKYFRLCNGKHDYNGKMTFVQYTNA